MKKWLWLVLLVLMMAVAFGSRNSLEQRPSPAIVQSIPSPIPQPQSEPPPVKSQLPVAADKLWHHVQNLKFQRYTNEERSRTRTYITTELQKLGWKPQLEKFTNGINIVATRPGTDKAAGTFSSPPIMILFLLPLVLMITLAVSPSC